VIFLCALKRFALPRIARKLATPVIAAGGCSLLIVAYLLISLSAKAALIAGAVFYGVGNGLMWPSYLVMLSHSGPPEYQGSVQGVGSSAGSLASIIGTVTGGVLYVTIGAATFYVSAAVVAVATSMFVVPMLGVHDGRARSGRAGRAGSRTRPASAHRKCTVRAPRSHRCIRARDRDRKVGRHRTDGPCDS